jgi:hypothetical protein
VIEAINTTIALGHRGKALPSTMAALCLDRCGRELKVEAS